MAIGYQYRLCENFPELIVPKQTIALDPQMILIGDQYRPAHTSITFDRQLSGNGFKKYLVIHETERKMRVRLESGLVESVIQQLDFNMYLSLDGSHAFISTKDTICDEFLRRVETMFTEFSFSERQIDLVKMVNEDASRISGGWFKNLKAADLSAAALFGDEVTGSKEWDRYTRDGSISILYLNYATGVNTYKVSVNKIGGIVLFNSLKEDAQIELVDSISRQIEPYVISIDINS